MNKVEKIKVEIERRKKTWNHQDPQYVAGGKDVCDYLLGFIDSLEEEPVSNNLEKAAHSYVDTTIEWFDSKGNPCCYPAFIAGAQWQKENLWKNAQGDDLPEIDREVIVLARALPEHEDSLLKVAFAHRPPEYWEGKNIDTGEITRYEPMRYDKGQWNIPAVVWWLDVKLPKEEE